MTRDALEDRDREPYREPDREPDRELELAVARAGSGDRDALEIVVRAIQPDVYRMAQRFLWHPQDAEDAMQEVLIRVITGLGSFRGESRFRTWVYRIATNTLLTLRRKGRMEQANLSFDEFGEDLVQGLSDTQPALDEAVEEALLFEEVRVGCTTAMLLCLDRPHRMAYILGEILELDHVEASAALEVTPAAYRKRLSRARVAISSFMTSHCGLVNRANPCRCRRRVAPAVALGRVDPARLLFARSVEQARAFPALLETIRGLEDTQRAAALYRAQRPEPPSDTFVAWLRGVIASQPHLA